MTADIEGLLLVKKIPSELHVEWIAREALKGWVGTFDNVPNFNFAIRQSDMVHYTEERLAKDLIGILNQFVLSKASKRLKTGSYLFLLQSEDFTIVGITYMENKRSSFITDIVDIGINPVGRFEPFSSLIYDSEERSNVYVLADRCKSLPSLIDAMSAMLNYVSGRTKKLMTVTDRYPKELNIKYDYTKKGTFELGHLFGSALDDEMSLEYVYDKISNLLKVKLIDNTGDNSSLLFHDVTFNRGGYEVYSYLDLVYLIYTFKNLMLAFVILVDGQRGYIAISAVGIYKNLTYMSILGYYKMDEVLDKKTFEIEKFVDDLFNK